MGLEALVDAARFLEYQAELEAQQARAVALMVAPFRTPPHPVLQLQQSQPQQPSPPTTPMPIKLEAVPLTTGEVYNIHVIMRPNMDHDNKTAVGMEPEPGTSIQSQPQSPSQGQGPSTPKRNQREKEMHSKQVREQRAEMKRLMDVLKKELPLTLDHVSPRSFTTMSMLRSTIQMIKEMHEMERCFLGEKDRLLLDRAFLGMKLAALEREAVLSTAYPMEEPGPWGEIVTVEEGEPAPSDNDNEIQVILQG